MLLCNVSDHLLCRDPDVVSVEFDLRPYSGATTASYTRHPPSDNHAKAVSAISATTGTFRFSQGPGDSPAQTGRSRARSERQSSRWEKSLPLSPGQLGSIPSLNGLPAGDYFSLAVWSPQRTAGSHGSPWMQGIFPAFEVLWLGCRRARAGNLASFSVFSHVSGRKWQGIFGGGAGNSETRRREFFAGAVGDA
jgi:hypothetical protein